MSAENSQHVASIYFLKPNKNEIAEAEVKFSLDVDKFNCLKDFSRALENYYQTNRKRKAKKRKSKKKQKVEVECYRPSSGYVPQESIFSVLQKSITNESFWSKEGLDILLENNYITPGLDDDVIFECILKYKSFSSLKLIAKSFNVVPEKYIIKTLKNIISMVEVDEAKPLHTKLYSLDCPVAEDVVVNLSYVMLLPINKVSLREYLKLLTVDEALLLLQCLHFLLYAVSPALGDKSSKTKSFDEEITESKVVVWLDLVLTAHLMAFTTSPTLNPLVSDIKVTIRKQQLFYNDIAQLGSYLRYLRETKTPPEKLIGEYVMETIRM